MRRARAVLGAIAYGEILIQVAKPAVDKAIEEGATEQDIRFIIKRFEDRYERYVEMLKEYE